MPLITIVLVLVVVGVLLWLINTYIPIGREVAFRGGSSSAHGHIIPNVFWRQDVGNRYSSGFI